MSKSILSVVACSAVGAAVWYLFASDLNLADYVLPRLVSYHACASWVAAACCGLAGWVASRGRARGLLVAAIGPTAGVVILTSFGSGGWRGWDTYLVAVGLGWIAMMGVAGGLLGEATARIGRILHRERDEAPASEASAWQRRAIGWTAFGAIMAATSGTLFFLGSRRADPWFAKIARVSVPVYPGAYGHRSDTGWGWSRWEYFVHKTYPSLAVPEYISRELARGGDWHASDVRETWTDHRLAFSPGPIWLPMPLLDRAPRSAPPFGFMMYWLAWGPGKQYTQSWRSARLGVALRLYVEDYSMAAEPDRPAWAKSADPVERVTMTVEEYPRPFLRELSRHRREHNK